MAPSDFMATTPENTVNTVEDLFYVKLWRSKTLVKTTVWRILSYLITILAKIEDHDIVENLSK